MINDVSELAIVQAVYVTVLILIIWTSWKEKKQRIAYLCIIATYALVIGWLVYEYFRFGGHADPGSVFAWAMTSIILPGLLVISAIIIFVVAKMLKKVK
jgi:hypothetical protein